MKDLMEGETFINRNMSRNLHKICMYILVYM